MLMDEIFIKVIFWVVNQNIITYWAGRDRFIGEYGEICERKQRRFSDIFSGGKYCGTWRDKVESSVW